ncbi:MAG: 4-(cytidine 5'-diphospho)-2-C-methyl-D-erythritol kinase [Acidobacteria bacterium]|nr:MAG: 4-(cytidine 5'-diphospho)-2-C-methyl-D-erythritol kinase [Acidobacteriota bacterium]
MALTVRSFAKINLGLYIGSPRADGFHDLRTVYQTISLYDVIRVSVARGTGIEIFCADPRVPCDQSNTCHRIAERVMEELDATGKVTIEIEKRLPVQGGLGAGSSNAVATMIGLERALKKRLTQGKRLRIAAAVGSDLPLFLVGGTVLGIGRGEEVFPMADLASQPVVIITPEVGVSTPRAFADWDAQVGGENPAELRSTWAGQRPVATSSRAGLTHLDGSDRLVDVGRALSAWLVTPNTGAPARGGSRAGSLLLDLVRTGIENDFERVVFPQYPELRDIKGALKRAGAAYASLSGSGSALYGLFRTRAAAAEAAKRLTKQGLRAEATTTLTRSQYWAKIV